MPNTIGSSLPPARGVANEINTLSSRLSSGERITSAKDDAAGAAIVQRIDAQLSGFDVAIRNAGDAISSAQTAEGALKGVRENLARVQELSLQAANGTLTDQDRRALDNEAQALLEDTRSLLEDSNFNGNSLLSGDNSLTVQFENAGDSTTLESRDVLQEIEDSGLFDISLASQSGAQSAISTTSDAQEITNSRASELGAFTNRLDSTIDQISSARTNAAEARSRIGDTDFAKTSTDLIANQIQDQVQIAVRGQANASEGFVLKLLGG